MIVNGTNSHGDFLMRLDYTTGQAHGVLALVIISVFSLVAVTGLLAAITLSAWNTRKSINPHMFVRSHGAAYLISMLFCDFLQSVGSLMNGKWYTGNGVVYGFHCTSQGVIKHAADVGTATWAFALAVHTFCVLFLNWNMRRYVLIVTLAGGWSFIWLIVLIGPALSNGKSSPFYGISGYWCWISNEYETERIVLDYMFLFMSALFSFLLYSLVFLSFSGYISLVGWRIRVHLKPEVNGRSGRANNEVIKIAKLMLLYPVVYTFSVLPIAICRFTAWRGHNVPLSAVIFSDAVFLLSGALNVLLFFTTRRVLPPHSVIPKSWYNLDPTPSVDDESFDFSDEQEKRTDEMMFKRVDSPDSDSFSEVPMPAKSALRLDIPPLPRSSADEPATFVDVSLNTGQNSSLGAPPTSLGVHSPRTHRT